MPAPLLLVRKSGFYCRFLVPSDLRQTLGQRYIVRSLGYCTRDEARWHASALALKLAAAFATLREGLSMDFNEFKAKVSIADIRDFTAKKITTRSGTVLEGVEVRNAEEVKLLNEFVQANGGMAENAPTATTPAPLPAAPVGPPRSASVDILLSERMAQHDKLNKKANKSEKLLDEYDRALRRLIALCGDKPPADYTVADADAYEDMLLNLPVYPKQHDVFQGLDEPKMAQMNKTLGHPKVGVRTIEKHFDRARAFFNWCIKRHYMSEPNHFSDRQIASKESRNEISRRPFDDDDVRRIFDAELYKSRNEPHLFWGPLLGMMTGARVNEIAQLYTADVVCDKGAYGFVIDKKRERQRLKNKHSRRSVPLHPKLVELGFIDYVEDVKRHGFDMLFPMLPWSDANGYGDALADAFHRGYLRSTTPTGTGVVRKRAAPRVGLDDPTKTFHSFRHRFCNEIYQRLSETNIKSEHVKEITGHEREGTFNEVYVVSLEFEKKIPIVNILPLPPLNMPPYKSGQYDAYFIKLKTKQRLAAGNAEAKAKRAAEAKADELEAAEAKQK